MPRHPRLVYLVRSALAVAAAATVLSSCSVLFVPRKDAPSPSPTPNTAVHQFPALEARLPDAIGGHPLQKFSLVSDPQAQSPKTLEVLRLLGKTIDDLQLAKALATGVDVTISALRIVGADAARAAAAFEQIDEGDPNTTTTYTPAVVVGKRVLVRTTGTVVEYLYPVEDIIFVVGGSRPLVEEALTDIH